MKVVVNGYNGEGREDMEFDVSYKRSVVYTTDGMYEQRKNKLWRIEQKPIVKKPVEFMPYKHLEFIVDYSDVIYTDILYHIPFDHICCEEVIQKKNIGHGIIFVKKSYFDQTCYYFEIEGKLESFMFKEMFSFLL